jgi:predicted O-methyltransferase YrrM
LLMSRFKALRQVVGLLETGNFLFLKLLFKNRAAAAQYPGDVYRTYMAYARDDHWQCRSIFEVLPDAGRVRAQIEHIPSGVIRTPLEQLSCLAVITKATEPLAVFEMGTFRGRTALNFALNSPPDARVYTLDLPPTNRESAQSDTNAADAAIIGESTTGSDYRNTDVEEKIVQLYGDSRTFDFSPYFQSMDLVYVDGAHDYEAVKEDSENAIRMLRPGGYALWDEFCNYGDYHDVTRAVLEVVPDGEVIHIENTQLALYRKPLA